MVELPQHVCLGYTGERPFGTAWALAFRMVREIYVRCPLHRRPVARGGRSDLAGDDLRHQLLTTPRATRGRNPLTVSRRASRWQRSSHLAAQRSSSLCRERPRDQHASNDGCANRNKQLRCVHPPQHPPRATDQDEPVTRVERVIALAYVTVRAAEVAVQAHAARSRVLRGARLTTPV